MSSSTSILLQSSEITAASLLQTMGSIVEPINLDSKEKNNIMLISAAKERLKLVIKGNIRNIKTLEELSELHKILTAKNVASQLTSKVAKVLNAHTGWGLTSGSVANTSSYTSVLQEIDEAIKQKEQQKIKYINTHLPRKYYHALLLSIYKNEASFPTGIMLNPPQTLQIGKIINYALLTEPSSVNPKSRLDKEILKSDMKEIAAEAKLDITILNSIIDDAYNKAAPIKSEKPVSSSSLPVSAAHVNPSETTESTESKKDMDLNNEQYSELVSKIRELIISSEAEVSTRFPFYYAILPYLKTALEAGLPVEKVEKAVTSYVPNNLLNDVERTELNRFLKYGSAKPQASPVATSIATTENSSEQDEELTGSPVFQRRHS